MTALPRNRKAAFEMLNDQRLLGAHETVSGAGSTLMATHTLRRGLSFLKEMGLLTSLLDVGCGDFHWMSAMDVLGVRYMGVDIVPLLIEDNRRRWPGVCFETLDIIETVPPKHEMALCKDLFTHLPLSDIAAAINNIKKSGARYLVASNYKTKLVKKSQTEFYRRNLNIDIPPAYWRPIDLNAAPFYFHPPLYSIPLNENGKSLDIWALEDVPPVTLSSESYENIGAREIASMDFLKALAALPFVEKICLYGSRAAGKHEADSDIDLMMYCEPQPTRAEWLEVCRIIDRAELPLEIDCKLHGAGLDSLFDRPNEGFINLITLYQR